MIGGPGGWWLSSEGAAVHEGERTAVISDVHLGYEWSRGRGGDVIPAHSLAETLAKLETLLGRVPVGRLVVAGDLVESAAPCPRTARDARGLAAWLADRGVKLVALAGNHDPPRRPPLPPTLDVAGWTVAHGHRPIAGERVIFGHHHPALRADGVNAPCFLAGPRAIALPAFSPNAAGADVCAWPLPGEWRGGPPRCFAALGGVILDFGPLAVLRSRLGGS